MGVGMNEPVWPAGREWARGDLPQPSVTLELSAAELLDVADSHALRAANAAHGGEDDARLFFAAPASYLRQKIAAVAPHLLALERSGAA
jgi:hypothetical protein